MESESLARVRKAGERKKRTEAAWQKAVKDAVRDGYSLRDVGRAAGVSHVRVLQITRERPVEPRYDATYFRQHRAVDKARGTAKECSQCGTTDTDKFYEWANLTGNYADVMDYARMCRTCHRRFDKARRGE